MKKYDIDIKNNTMNYNLDILINNIKANIDEFVDRENGYAEYLIARLEMLKDKNKKYCGIKRQKGTKIKDVFNDKIYLSMREAQRKTGLNIAQIKYSMENNVGLTKAFKFEEIGDNINE